MFDEKNHDRNDALGQRLQKIGGQMNPSPELKKAAKTGVPLRAGGIKYTAGTHVRKFTKAVLLYAACIMLFLGAILLIPRWFGGNEPTPGGSVDPVVTTKSPEECEHDYIDELPLSPVDCTKDLIYRSICKHCRHIVHHNIPAPGHDYVDGICKRCGEHEEFPPDVTCVHDQDPATCLYCNCDGHEYEITSPELVNPCIDDRSEIYTCKKCNYSYTETIPAPGHDYKDDTCTRCGKEDIAVGAYVALTVSRHSMQEFLEFYAVFQRKNTAPIVVTDLGDQKDSITRYQFYGGIINKDTFPDDFDYDYSSSEIRVPVQFWYSFYYNCNDAFLGTYDYVIVAENYTLDNDAVIDLDNVRMERVSTGLETFYAKSELRDKDGEIRYYEIYSGDHRLMKFAISAVASTEDSYYDAICQQVIDGLVKLG